MDEYCAERQYADPHDELRGPRYRANSGGENDHAWLSLSYSVQKVRLMFIVVRLTPLADVGCRNVGDVITPL